MFSGSPGNNFAQTGTCRYDSSLGNDLYHKLMFEEMNFWTINFFL